jgi:hypothetical protein
MSFRLKYACFKGWLISCCKLILRLRSAIIFFSNSFHSDDRNYKWPIFLKLGSVDPYSGLVCCRVGKLNVAFMIFLITSLSASSENGNMPVSNL